MPALLLDRDDELRSLDALIADAERGAGRMAVVEGAPGIGKTSLLLETRRRAVDRGLRVLHARGSELEQSFAFGIAHQLLESELTSEAARGELMAGAAGLAEPVFTHHSGTAGPVDPSYPVLHGLYWLTANIARQGPLLLLLDDAQWADSPSIRFLHFLAQRLEGLRICVVVGTRAGVGAFSTDQSAAALRDSESLKPSNLDIEAVRKIIRVRAGDAAAEQLGTACKRATGGNPFLLEELLRSIGDRSGEERAISAAEIEKMGPESISRATLERVRRVAGAPELARAVAILGDGTGLADAATLAETDAGEAARIADTLARESILDPGTDLGFSHPIVRIAVYESIAPGERAEMHRRAGAIISERGAPPNAVAGHLLLAARRGDPEVVRQLRAHASAAIVSGAPESAVECLQRALEEPPTEEVRPALLFELGSAQGMVASPDAVETLRSSLGLTSDPQGRARIALALADALQHSGDLAGGVAALEQAIGDLPQGDIALAPRLEGRLLPLACTGVSGRKLVGERLSNALAHIDELTPEHARVVRASAAFDCVTGEGANALAAIELARASLADGYLLSSQSADPVFAIGAVNALFLADRFEEAERSFDSLLEYAQKAGSVNNFATFSVMRSWSRYLSGSLSGAEADARSCLEAPGDPSFFLLYPLAAFTLGNVLLERGATQEAKQVIAPLDMFRTDDDLGFSQLLHTLRSRLALLDGDGAAALRALEPCRRFEHAWGINPGIASVVPWRVAAVEALVALDRREDASSLAREQLDLARQFGAARPIGGALRSVARTEDPISTVSTLDEAVNVLADSGAQLELAGALIELGSALRRGGKRSPAQAALLEGVDLAHRAGASALAARGREELVAAGARPRRLALTGPESLTASERRVVEMAIGGMTNREIAQALFVTLRTVEGHLTNAFRKLRVSSRDELAAAMRADPSATRPAPSQTA